MLESANQCQARQLLGLPQDCPLLLFGAMGGGNDPRKGIDLLFGSLSKLSNDPSLRGLQLVVFGQSSQISIFGTISNALHRSSARRFESRLV